MGLWSRGDGADDDVEMMRTGNQLFRDRDWLGAAVAYRRAARSKDPRTAALSSIALGVAYARTGQVRQARRMWRRARAKGDTAVALIASMYLLTSAVDPSHGGAQEAALFQLLDLDQADPSLSKDAAIRASNVNIAVSRAHAQGTDESLAAAEFMRRAFEHERRGEVHKARELYQKVIGSGHPDHAPNAADTLGLLLEEQGDLDGAEVAYRRAMASGHPEHIGWSAVRLGNLLVQRQDLRRAVAAYQQAMDTGDPTCAPVAADMLGTVLSVLGDAREARRAWEYAVRHGSPDIAAAAREKLRKAAGTS